MTKDDGGDTFLFGIGVVWGAGTAMLFGPSFSVGVLIAGLALTIWGFWRMFNE